MNTTPPTRSDTRLATSRQSSSPGRARQACGACNVRAVRDTASNRSAIRARHLLEQGVSMIHPGPHQLSPWTAPFDWNLPPPPPAKLWKTTWTTSQHVLQINKGLFLTRWKVSMQANRVSIIWMLSFSYLTVTLPFYRLQAHQFNSWMKWGQQTEQQVASSQSVFGGATSLNSHP